MMSHAPKQLRSIGEVVRDLNPTFPDVSHSSLRFLEREGLIRSTRTEGRHRLYSDADVARIVRIKRWQAERLSLDEIRTRLAALERLPDLPTLTADFVEEASAGNLGEAGELITRADDVGLPLQALFADVLTPALHEVGDRWERGEVSVAREKEISELSRELIVDLTRRHAVTEAAGPMIVAACIEGEKHELGLRMVTGLLRERGYRVSFLGADVALRFLLDAVSMRSPEVVLLSAKQEFTQPALEVAIEALNAVREALGRNAFAIIVGGDIAERDPAWIEARGAIPVASPDPALVFGTIERAITDRERE